MSNEEKTRAEGFGIITRREWLLRFGGTAAVLGLGGNAGQESFAGVDHATAGHSPAAGELPPGIYAPSVDHMSHALTDNERFIPVPPGTQTELVVRRNGPFETQFFTADEYKVVQRLVELMLDAPTTPAQASLKPLDSDTRDEVAEWLDEAIYCSADVRKAATQLAPRFRIMALNYFGEQAVREMETNEDQRYSREGLAWLAETAQKRYEKPFLALDAEQQIAILSSISERPAKPSDETPGTRFFALLKRHVSDGYYTSQRGREELGYPDYMYSADSPGCPKDGLTTVKP
jgi:ribosomal protein S7